jgi:hypothetical protein
MESSQTLLYRNSLPLGLTGLARISGGVPLRFTRKEGVLYGTKALDIQRSVIFISCSPGVLHDVPGVTFAPTTGENRFPVHDCLQSPRAKDQFSPSR